MTETQHHNWYVTPGPRRSLLGWLKCMVGLHRWWDGPGLWGSDAPRTVFDELFYEHCARSPCPRTRCRLNPRHDEEKRCQTIRRHAEMMREYEENVRS